MSNRRGAVWKWMSGLIGLLAVCASAADPPMAVSRIIGQALAPSPLAEDLRRLTDEVGGRVTGSPAMARAADWALQAFQSAGVPAHAEAFAIPLTWEEGATRLDIVRGPPMAVSLVSEGWSMPTPAAGIEADLVHVGAGAPEDFARIGARAQGSILLVDAPVIRTWADLDDEYTRAVPIKHRAVDAGARAMLWTAGREHQLLYRHTDTVNGELTALPMATVAREDAMRLARMTEAASSPLRVRLTMPNRIGGPAHDRNIVAEIRGSEHPDEIVVLGAHLDSWDLGTGALDNGCNAALVIAVARAIQESGVHPKRTIRFVLFSGEEVGFLGSRAYVHAHRSELDKTRAMVVIDSGGGRITGFDVTGRSDVAHSLHDVLLPVAPFDADRVMLDGSLGTDNVDFMLEGVPTLIADQEASNLMQNYHAASDTFDKVDLRQLTQHVAIMAATVFGIAERDAPLGPRMSRAEVDRLLVQTGLDKQMKATDLWEDWAAGRRGRER